MAFVDHFLERCVRRICGEKAPEQKIRSAYGFGTSLVGVGCNLLLFLSKLAVALLSGSLSIAADAFNNLSDAASSLISLIGFKLAARPADEKHPYGHGRYEYLSGLMIALMILLIGFELLEDSVQKILSPSPVRFSWITVVVLLLSISMKLWMAAFYRRIGKQINAASLLASADDSRNDVLSTAGVLLAALVAHFSGLQLDGIVGAVVALFILVSGFSLVREMIDPLLGKPVSREQMLAIRKKIRSYPGVLGTHDLLVHDYGPGHQFASVHVEMSDQVDPMVSHDTIDNIERDFLAQEGLQLVIHYDPVAVDDPRIAAMRVFLSDAVKQIHSDMSVHDVRIVAGSTHVNVVFDCVAPYSLPMKEQEIQATLQKIMNQHYPNYYCIMTLEHSYVETT